MLKTLARQVLAVAALVLVLALPALADAPAPGSTIPHLTQGDFLRTVSKADVPVLVQFDASWCPYCHKMQPHLDKLRADKGDKLRVYKVDADDEQELMNSYSVRTLPTLLVFYKGAVIGRNNGSMPGEQLADWIDGLQKKVAQAPDAKPAVDMPKVQGL
ncbi:MAG: thioredoxin family protein [Micavibrio sp.]|nr:thioredoxin family protein [Micavibrio sp.]